MMNKVLSVAKALVAAVTALLGSLAVAVQDGSSVTQGEWIAAAVVGVTALAAVYGVPNMTLNKTNDA